MAMGDELEFYQIRIFRKGEIEIFQNVFSHKVHVEDGVMKTIEVKYSSSGNIGNSTHSMRPMDGVYDVQLLDDPKYMQYWDKPKNVEVIIH